MFINFQTIHAVMDASYCYFVSPPSNACKNGSFAPSLGASRHRSAPQFPVTRLAASTDLQFIMTHHECNRNSILELCRAVAASVQCRIVCVCVCVFVRACCAVRGPSRGLEFFDLVRRVVSSVLCGALCIGGPKTDTVHRNCFRHVSPRRSWHISGMCPKRTMYGVSEFFVGEKTHLPRFLALRAHLRNPALSSSQRAADGKLCTRLPFPKVPRTVAAFAHMSKKTFDK